MQLVWVGLVLLRIIWSALPQTGYIHPDEFFQTVEVPTGDTLNVSVVRTWEFKEDFPLRSIVLPKVLFQPLLYFLHWLCLEQGLFDKTGHLVIVSSRLVMLVLTLWMDYCVDKICSLIGGKCSTAGFLLAGSYVTLTFQTHSFSNSIETVILITVLLIIVALVKKKKMYDVEGEYRTAMIVDLEKSLEQKRSQLDPIYDLHKMAYGMRKRDKQRINPTVELFNRTKEYEEVLELDRKLIEHVKKDSKTSKETCYVQVTALAMINMLGFFNRPTFVLFALGPLLWWMYTFRSSKILFRLFTVFLVSSFITFVAIALEDTCYYSGIDASTMFIMISELSLDSLKDLVSSLKITPLNFVIYNTASDNLADHGIHPRFLHVLVNMPLLFGPMCVPLVYLTVSIIKSWAKPVKLNSSTGKHTVDRNPKDNQDSKKELSSVNAEVNEKIQSDLKRLLLVFILIPLLGLSIFPHQEPRFLIPLLPLVVLAVTLECKRGLHKLFWILYISFNLPLAVIFGAFHQGGVVPCLLHLQNITSEMKETHPSEATDIVFSHTYMPPKHLLLIDNQREVNLYDMQGQELSRVCDFFKQLYTQKAEDEKINQRKQIPYLVLPGNLAEDFKQVCGQNLQLKHVKSFFPHLSFDDPPDFKAIEDFSSFHNLFSLNLFEVSVT